MTGPQKLRFFLGAQLLVFAAWGGWLMYSRSAESAEFVLDTVPVDPRDLVSGTYVALNYQISSPEACRPLLEAGAAEAYVELKDSGRRLNTGAGALPAYEAAGCAAAPGSGVWARAEIYGGFAGRINARYGIERFYVNENDPLKNSAAGSVAARVKLGRGNRLTILGLEKKI